jgi:alpha-L-fucosidase
VSGYREKANQVPPPADQKMVDGTQGPQPGGIMRRGTGKAGAGTAFAFRLANAGRQIKQGGMSVERPAPAPPSKALSWFVAARFGMFIHWGTYALPARHEWVKNHEALSEAEYQKYFQYFNPDRFEPRAWARHCREAGMRYLVFTTKHHEGFCMWDTAQTDYKVTRTPFGRDLLAETVEAFRAEGLRIGFYYSLLDWHHPHYTIDRMHPRSPLSSDPAAFEKLNEGREMPVYAAYMREQVRELLTGYGPVDLMWFDFSFAADWRIDDRFFLGVGQIPGPGKGTEDWESEKLLALVRELQPQALVNNRLGLEEGGDFTTPEQFQPQSAPTDAVGNPLVWEACQTFSGSWGYHRDEQTWKSTKMLLTLLIDGVSKGGNLLLNVGPTARGEFDHRARERLAAMGLWMDRHGRSIYGCGPAPCELGIQTPVDCRLTYHPERHRLYVHVLNWPFRHVYVPGLRGKVDYAQLLNDGSEVLLREHPGAQHTRADEDVAVLEVPVVQPPVEVPVIEVMLKR